MSVYDISKVDLLHEVVMYFLLLTSLSVNVSYVITSKFPSPPSHAILLIPIRSKIRDSKNKSLLMS